MRPVTHDELRTALATADLDPSDIVSARPLAGAARYGLTLDDGAVAMVTASPTLVGRSAAHAATAAAWLQGGQLVAPVLPIAHRARHYLVDRGIAPPSAPPPPDALRELGRTVAGAAAGLAQRPAPRFGFTASEAEFWPLSPTWGQECARLAVALADHALRHNRDLGPLTERLVAKVAGAHRALDGASGWTLVHRDLGFETVHPVHGRALVSGLDRTGFGDPLLTWASAFIAPGAALAGFLEALGAAAGQALASDDATARLEAYLALYLLELLAQPPGEDLGGRYRATANAERVARILHGWPGVRARAARAGGPDDPFDDISIEATIADRYVLSRLSALPELTLPELDAALGALGASALNASLTGSAALRLADPLLPLLSVPSAARASRAPQECRATIERIAAASLVRPSPILHRTAALAWLGIGAIDRLGGDVPNAAWTGLAEHVALTSVLDPVLDARLAAQGPQVRAALALPHGTLALAALRSGHLPADDRVERRLLSTLRGAAEHLQTRQQVLLGAREPLPDVVERLGGLRLPAGAEILPAVLLAAHRIDQELLDLLSPDAFPALYGVTLARGQGG